MTGYHRTDEASQLENIMSDMKTFKELKIDIDGECFPTNRVFSGWFGDARMGEKYWSEWQCYAVNTDGERYKIVWLFPAVKGAEPEDDGWQWDDESFIDRIEII